MKPVNGSTAPPAKLLQALPVLPVALRLGGGDGAAVLVIARIATLGHRLGPRREGRRGLGLRSARNGRQGRHVTRAPVGLGLGLTLGLRLGLRVAAQRLALGLRLHRREHQAGERVEQGEAAHQCALPA